MKIRLNPRRGEAGGWFLVIALVVIVLVIGGCAVYHLHKMIKLLPPQQGPLPPGQTNDNSNLLAPAGKADEVSAYQWRHWTTYVEDTNSALASPALPSPHWNPVIRVGITNGTLYVATAKDSGWSEFDMTPYVDENGWLETGYPPAGIRVMVQRSVDFVNWHDFMPVYVQPEKEVLVRDTDVYPDGVFYRAVSQ